MKIKWYVDQNIEQINRFSIILTQKCNFWFAISRVEVFLDNLAFNKLFRLECYALNDFSADSKV